MNKVISLLLALTLCLPLCACGTDDPRNTNPTESVPATESTGAPAQSAPEESAGVSTENPIDCSHKYNAKENNPATCSETGLMVYSCSECGHEYQEETPANGHDYVDGTCSVCGGAQEKYKALNSGKWIAQQVVGNFLYAISLDFAENFFDCGYGSDINTLDSDFRDQLLQAYEQDKNALTVIDGVYYYIGMGDGGSITYTANGNSIEVSCEYGIYLKIERTAGDQLMIVESNIRENPSGILLTWLG